MHSGVLAQHPLREPKVHVKLDKGFQDGTYCVFVEYDDLAAEKGFRSAHLTAKAYCALLREQLGKGKGFSRGKIDDPSQTDDPTKKRDLECTFLSFPLEYADQEYHDEDIGEQFRVALIRANQAWEQAQARGHTDRRNTRQGHFRHKLEGLLDGEAYSHVDAATKQRLTEEVTRLVFPERGLEP